MDNQEKTGGTESLVRVSLVCGKSGDLITPKLAQLLHEIDRLGSIARASKQLRMSYSHAWDMLSTAEGALGHALVLRHGALGSNLSEFGSELLVRYEQLDETANELARAAFAKLLDAS